MYQIDPRWGGSLKGGRDYCVRLFRQTSEQIAAERASERFAERNGSKWGQLWNDSAISLALSRQPVDVCSAMVVSS